MASKHNEPQFEVLNGSVVQDSKTFTVSDDEEDEGFVAEQPEDGGCIRVALWRDPPSRGLSVGGRDLRMLLKHCREHKNTNSSGHQSHTSQRTLHLHIVIVRRKPHISIF